MNRRSLTISISLFAFLPLLYSCVIQGHMQEVVHDPPIGVNVSRIEKGLTTGAEVLDMLGPPDFEAHGSRLIFHDETPMNRWLSRMKKKQEEHMKKHYQGELPEDSGPGFQELNAYSSLDDEHVAFFYSELRAGFKPGGSGGVWRNKLLIFIDKKTDLVEEVSYREEFSP